MVLFTLTEPEAGRPSENWGHRSPCGAREDGEGGAEALRADATTSAPSQGTFIPPLRLLSRPRSGQRQLIQPR